MFENTEVPMLGTTLIVAAITKACQDQTTTHAEWIRASFQIGGQLPTSNLTASVQALGKLDLLIRMMEDEAFNAPTGSNEADIAIGMALTHQCMFSDLWVGSAYEICRLLRQRSLAPDSDSFRRLLRDLELLRMPLEKHELASDHKIKAPIAMRRAPAQPDDTDIFYDAKDPLRSHIMPMSRSARGSMMWHVLDVVEKSGHWLELRRLSDRFLDVFASEDARPSSAERATDE